MKFTLDTQAARLVADALEFMEPTGDDPDPAKELAKAIRAGIAMEEAGIPGVEMELMSDIEKCAEYEADERTRISNTPEDEDDHDDECTCDECDPFNFKKKGIC